MVWTSPYEPIDPHGPPLPELVRRSAARLPGRPALVDGFTGDAVPYASLVEKMDRVAAGLSARGFARGDVLAVWAPNTPAWAEVALGCMAAGGAMTGVSPLATERELATQVEDAGAWSRSRPSSTRRAPRRSPRSS
jgi:acyl-CoA synthetase (AMP-forming)/AMP-acid ligase II